MIQLTMKSLDRVLQKESARVERDNDNDNDNDSFIFRRGGFDKTVNFQTCRLYIYIYTKIRKSNIVIKEER